jgi:hypothetical protein
MHLDRIRVKATDDQVNEIVARVKRESMRKKGLLDDSGFRKIVKQVVR